MQIYMAGFLEYVLPEPIQAHPSCLQLGYCHALATPRERRA